MNGIAFSRELVEPVAQESAIGRARQQPAPKRALAFGWQSPPDSSRSMGGTGLR